MDGGVLQHGWPSPELGLGGHARSRAAPAGVCAGLDSHMGSGVRGAAETRLVS